MKKIIIWILIIPLMALATGCHKKQVQEKPEKLIPRNTIVKMVAECFVIENMVGYNPADTVNRFESTKAYYKDMFDRYQVTREQFNTSIQYYFGDEDMAEKILNEANAIITKQKNELVTTDTSTIPDPAAVDIMYENMNN